MVGGREREREKEIVASLHRSITRSLHRCTVPSSHRSILTTPHPRIISSVDSTPSLSLFVPCVGRRDDWR